MRYREAKNRSRAKRALARTAALAAAVSVVAAPGSANATPLSDAEIEGLISTFAAQVAKEPQKDGKSLDPATASLFIRMEARDHALVDVDASCPVKGKVSNLSTQPMFNVAVTVSESATRSGVGIESTIHIAYLAPKTQVRISIPCKTSSLGFGTKYISGDGFAPTSPLTAEGIAAMMAQSADSESGSLGAFSPSSTLTGTVADQVLLAVPAGAAFGDIVSSLLQFEKGGAIVGKYAASTPFGAKTGQLSTLLAGASHGAAVAVIEALSSDASGLTSTLVTPLIEKVCGKAVPERDRGALWVRALSGKMKGSAEARSAIVKKCAGTAAQTTARLKEAPDAELAAALDALDGAAFDAAIKVADGPPKRFEAIAGLMRATADAKKFAAVTRKYALSSITSPDAIRELVRAVAASQSGALDAEKAAFVGSGLDRLHGLAAKDGEALIGELYGLVVKSKIDVAPIAEAIKARASVAPDAVKEALAAMVRDESSFLTPEWVLARAEQKQLDLPAFLEFNRSRLGNCTSSAGALRECLSRLPEAAPGVGREAFSPELVTRAQRLAWDAADPDSVVLTAKSLRAVGIDDKPIVEHLCAEADHPSRHLLDKEAHAERLLEAALSLDAGATCVAVVRSNLRWRRVTAVGDMILRCLVMLVPIGLGVLYLRRSWAPVRKKLRAATREVAEAQAASGGERRIDPGTWSRAIKEGMAHAVQMLEGETSDDLRAVASHLRGIKAEEREEIIKKARRAANDTILSGDVHSLLVKLPDALVYVVCFAGSAAQPQTVRRHAAFRDGWEAHAARVREAAGVESPGLPLLGLLFFLHADAVTGTMLVALEGDGVSVVPERLLGEREARTKVGRVNRHHHDFELEGAKKPAPAAEEQAAAAEG